MLPWDPNNKSGPKQPLPDNVSVLEPKEEYISAEEKAAKLLDVVAPAVVQVAVWMRGYSG